MCGEDVITMKHKAAQKRVRRTHWVLLSGFRIVRLSLNGKDEVAWLVLSDNKPCQPVREEFVI